jgi:hypothetical protein
MEQNVGSTDRIARAFLGALLAVAGIAGVGGFLAVGTQIGAVLAVIGVVLIGTAAVRLCLVYKLLGIRTTP